MKDFLASKYLRFSMVVAALAASLMTAAFASEGSSSGFDTISASFTTGFQQIASDALKMLALIVPIGLGVAGVVFLAKRAFSWFKSMTK